MPNSVKETEGFFKTDRERILKRWVRVYLITDNLERAKRNSGEFGKDAMFFKAVGSDNESHLACLKHFVSSSRMGEFALILVDKEENEWTIDGETEDRLKTYAQLTTTLLIGGRAQVHFVGVCTPGTTAEKLPNKKIKQIDDPQDAGACLDGGYLVNYKGAKELAKNKEAFLEVDTYTPDHTLLGTQKEKAQASSEPCSCTNKYVLPSLYATAGVLVAIIMIYTYVYYKGKRVQDNK